MARLLSVLFPRLAAKKIKRVAAARADLMERLEANRKKHRETSAIRRALRDLTTLQLELEMGR